MASNKLGAWSCHGGLEGVQLLSNASHAGGRALGRTIPKLPCRKVVADRSRGMLPGVVLSLAMLRRHHLGGVCCHSVMRNFSLIIKSSSASEIEQSVAEMLSQVNKKVGALKDAMQKGSAPQLNPMKDDLKKDFVTMTEATRDLKELVANVLSKNGGQDEDWLRLARSMDAMRNKVVRIRKELEAMKIMTPAISPQAATVLGEANILEARMMSELKIGPESSMAQLLGALKTSLKEGNNGAECLREILAELDTMVADGSAEDKEKAIALESGSVASFVEKYLDVFEVSGIIVPKQRMVQEDPSNSLSQVVEEEELDSNGDSKMSLKSNVDDSTSAPPAPVKDENALGSRVSPFVTGGSSTFLPDIDDYVFDGGYNGGGGNGYGDKGDGSGDDDDVDDTSAIWTVLMLMIVYILFLMLCLQSNKYFSLYWNQFINTGHPKENSSLIEALTSSSSSDNETDGDEERNGASSSGGPAGWLLSQPKMRKVKSPKQEEPILGYVLSGALFVLSVILVKGFSS